MAFIKERFNITKINFNGNEVNAISARELHKKLDSRQDFSNWIKKRLAVCNAIEGEDFITYKDNANAEGRLFNNFIEKSNERPIMNMYAGIINDDFNERYGRPKLEYIISLELAKHIAMLEKNDIGRNIRQYFIDYEARARKVLDSSSGIQSLLDIAETQIQAIKATHESLKIVINRVSVLESTKRLEAWQEKALSDNVKAKVALLTKGRDVGTNIKSSYFRAIYKRLKSRFYVARYSEIPSVKFDEAMSYVASISQDDLIY